MNITQVKIFPVHEDKLKAFVSLVFDHDFMINDLKIIQGRDGLFLSMPSRRKKNGEFKDVAHPLNNRTRRMLEERVLAEYRQVVHDTTPRRPDRSVPSPKPPAEGAPSTPTSSAAVPVPDLASPPEPPSEVVVAAGDSPSGEQTLEEVRKRHLSDSFWTMS